MDIANTDTALVFIDPQNDVLSDRGTSWDAVGASVTENRTVEHMEALFEAAKSSDYQVFISPTTSIRPTAGGGSTARWKPRSS
ncbi:hypothetical protein [Mycobacterium sp. URHB0021]